MDHLTILATLAPFGFTDIPDVEESEDSPAFLSDIPPAYQGAISELAQGLKNDDQAMDPVSVGMNLAIVAYNLRDCLPPGAALFLALSAASLLKDAPPDVLGSPDTQH